MADIRRTAGALALLAAVAAHAAHATTIVTPPSLPTSAGLAGAVSTSAEERAGVTWSEELPAGRASALLLLAAIGLLGLRASRNRE